MSFITIEAWEAKGLELFGENKWFWVFHCPSCGNEMSIIRAMSEFPQLKDKGWVPEGECIGRYIDVPAAQMAPGKPCDWCAYGLFRGPLIVRAVDRGDPPDLYTEYAIFDFGGQPFTKEQNRATSVLPKVRPT